MNIKNILIAVLSVSLVFSILHHLKYDQEEHGSCDNRYKYISLDLNCDDDPSENTKHIKDAVNDVIKLNISLKKADKVSVFYRDLDNRQWFGINENALFSPASLLKLPLAIAYYSLSQVDKSVLGKTIIYKQDSNGFYGIQNIKPEIELEADKAYTVDELIRSMLQNSDNVAMQLLGEHVNEKYLDMIYSDLGIVYPEIIPSDQDQDFVSVRVYAAIFRSLFNASYLNQELSDKLLQVMAGSKYDKGIVAGLPKGTLVANKFGERKAVDTNSGGLVGLELHDCGIVYIPGRPYVLCIMTEGNQFSTLETVIADISKAVYSNR